MSIIIQNTNLLQAIFDNVDGVRTQAAPIVRTQIRDDGTIEQVSHPVWDSNIVARVVGTDIVIDVVEDEDDPGRSTLADDIQAFVDAY